MYKASMEIARINRSMKLKFGIIVISDDEYRFPNLRTCSKFNYRGNDYFRFNPSPFVVIDISSTVSKEERGVFHTVSLNRYSLFRFIQGLRKFIQSFRDERNLFYYRNETLKVNSELVQKTSVTIPTASGKTIRMEPCVVTDLEDDYESNYEGCLFCINSLAYSCYLTFNEMEYLLYEISRINMTELSCELYQMAMSCKDEPGETFTPVINEIQEKPANENHESPRLTIIRSGEIPDI